MDIVKFKDNKYGVRLETVDGYAFAGQIGNSDTSDIYTWEARETSKRKYWAMDREKALALRELLEPSMDFGEVVEGI